MRKELSASAVRWRVIQSEFITKGRYDRGITEIFQTEGGPRAGSGAATIAASRAAGIERNA